MYGLPVGEDMDGRVVTGAFETPPEVLTIESWKMWRVRIGRIRPHTRLDPVAAAEAIQKLVRARLDPRSPARTWKSTSNPRCANCATTCSKPYQRARGRHQEALEILAREFGGSARSG